MGSGQQRRAEMGAAGAGTWSTGAERERERARLRDNTENAKGDRSAGREEENRKREAGVEAGRPLGDPNLQRGKVASERAKNTGEHMYTQQNHARKEGKRITSVPAGSLGMLIIIWIIIIIITTKRESGQDT